MKRAILLLGLVGMLAWPTLLFAQIPGLEVVEADLRPEWVSDDMLLNADQDPNNWLLYGRNYKNNRYSPLEQIDRDNVGDLTADWAFSFGVLEGQDSQAVVHNGAVFVTTSFNRVYRLDGESGDVVWSYKRDLPSDVFPVLCCDVVNRGVALYHDKAYLATLDSHVVALDRMNGEVVWDTTVEDYKGGYSLTLMPQAIDGKIIVGVSGAEYGIRGFISALDAETGEPVWKTYTVAGPDDPHGNVDTWGGDSWQRGGGSAWITGSYDPELNNLYWPTGNPSPDFHGAIRPGDNLYTNSTMVLNPDNGNLKFWFQYTPHDVWDYDGVNEVILADVDGEKVWLHGDRNGFLYNIDRTNGQCNWAVPLSKINWMTGFGENCRPIVNPEKSPEAMGYDTVTRNIHPSLDGGKEWHPMAYNPDHQLVYVPTYNYGMDVQPLRQEWERGQWWLGAKVLRLTDGNGAVKAYDAATGELAWSNPMNTPATSGMLTTAGDLLFYGDPRGYFHAVDAVTGEKLWNFNTGTGVHGNPTSFTVNGEQKIAIVVGPGGGGLWPLHYGEWLKNNTKGGGMFVFSLHDDE